jgi:membrane associated rhomboid family serine protease
MFMNTLFIGLYVLIGANVLFSIKGFNDRLFFSENAFTVSGILVHKQYKRIISSGFLHVDWTHLLFNMFALYSFGQLLLQLVGSWQFFGIYFISLIGGSLLSLFINKSKSYYSAVGASGAVSGVIFACIALYPDVGIYIFFIPIEIPGWVFGPVFILFSIYGMRRQADNIGHEAHLGGAVIGMLVAVLFNPFVLSANWLVIVAILFPTIAFMVYLARKPPVSNWVKSKEQTYPTADDAYHAQKANKKRRMDELLDKANNEGWESLTQTELDELDELANGK